MVDPIPLHGTSMHDGVAARLRAMVFERELKPGDYIDEMALAARWSISRTPLREALKVLAAEGLVELVPRRGCRVVEMTDADAEALLPVMALLEGRCAFEAVRKAGDDDVAELKRLHDQLERHAAAHNIDGYYAANHAFHSRVQALADNRWLDRVTGDLRKFVRLWRGRQLALPGPHRRVDQRAPRADRCDRAARCGARRTRDARPSDGAAHGAQGLAATRIQTRGAAAQGGTPCWLN